MNKVTDFMGEDHDRLDEIFREFQAVKNNDLAEASTLFSQFNEGLQRHKQLEGGKKSSPFCVSRQCWRVPAVLASENGYYVAPRWLGQEAVNAAYRH